MQPSLPANELPVITAAECQLIPDWKVSSAPETPLGPGNVDFVYDSSQGGLMQHQL